MFWFERHGTKVVMVVGSQLDTDPSTFEFVLDTGDERYAELIVRQLRIARDEWQKEVARAATFILYDDPEGLSQLKRRLRRWNISKQKWEGRDE